MKNRNVISGFCRFLTFSLLIATVSFPLPRAQTTGPAANHPPKTVHPAGVLAVGATGTNSNPGIGGRGTQNPIQVLRQIQGPNHTVTLVCFNYATGTASRVVRDESSKKVLQEQKFPGRPQSSRQEFEEAVRIIRRDPDQAGLMTDAVPEGGFIVDGPAGHPSNHRYVQIRLLSPDRRTLMRVALVDLTAGVVASARDSF